MFSTVILVTGLVGTQFASLLLWALFLRLGLHWAKVPAVTTRRLVLATIIVIVLQAAVSVSFAFFWPSTNTASIILSFVALAASIIIPCATIGIVFKARFLQAFQAWLPTLVATIVGLASAVLLLRPFFYESFVISANDMAPTLLGRHWQGTCPKCGRPNYCSPREYGGESPYPRKMICDNFHITEPADIDKRVYSSDRLLAAKFLSPQRWDLIVFRLPNDPSTVYVKRLVGLPGEKIHIEDGFVWADGKRQTPPPSLPGIEYLVEFPEAPGQEFWGSPKRPALLEKDEYFVLGDFSAQSMDSRMWEEGAPGHNPFAVPQSHLCGVVTHTYWPPHRWRIHR
jgi:signal peptidase I